MRGSVGHLCVPLLLLPWLVAASGCESHDPPDWPSVYRLAGTIVAAGTGAAIPGAEFILAWPAGAFGDGSASTQADEDGQYFLEVDFLSPAHCEAFDLVVRAAGFQQVWRDPGGVRCTSEIQRFDFELAPSP